MSACCSTSMGAEGEPSPLLLMPDTEEGPAAPSAANDGPGVVKPPITDEDELAKFERRGP